MKWKKYFRKGWWLAVSALLVGFTGLVVLGFSVGTYVASLKKEPEEVKIAQVTIGTTYSQDGQVRVYYYDLCMPAPGGIGTDLLVNDNNIYDLNGEKVTVDSIEVQAGDKVVVNLWDHRQEFYGGYMGPNSDDTCGTGTNKKDISGFIAEAEAAGEKIESIQCWDGNGYIIDSNGGNYNVASLILSYVPGAGGSPSPSSSGWTPPFPSRSPFPSGGSLPPFPSIEPRACYQKCLFDFGCEEGLECQGEGIMSRKCVNPDCPEEEDCECGTASPSPSPSSAVSPSPSVSSIPLKSPLPTPEVSFPPTQPDTGTATWITVGTILVGAGLLIAKILIGF